MLKAITFGNFKSFRSGRLPLGSLTVLIGANASGKSNSIEALRFLSWMAQGSKLSALQYSMGTDESAVRGRVEDLAYCQGESFDLGCETSEPQWNSLSMTISRRTDGLHITHEILSNPALQVPLYELDGPSTGPGTDVNVAYNNFSRGGYKPHLRCSDQLPIFTQLTSPASFAADQKQSREKIPAAVKHYESWLSDMLFLDPVPARMRTYEFPSDKQLRGDGSNLSGVLSNLWGNDAEAQAEPFATQRREILSFIQSLPEQDISGIDFIVEPRGGKMIQLKETFGGQERQYDATLLSDGTLRVLAIAAAMLSSDEGSLVVIEEIDNGVHPSRARHLLERIQAISQRRKLRVLLSTHNPALLDALPDSALPDVVFCYRSPEDGASKLVRLEEVPDYPELFVQGTLGHLVTNRILESFVKQDHAPETRKTNALSWLESVRTGSES